METNLPQYRIESAITGTGYDLDNSPPLATRNPDGYAAAMLAEQAGETRRANGSNIWTLWRDNVRVAQVRVFDSHCIYWKSRNFNFDFHGYQTQKSITEPIRAADSLDILRG